MDFDGDHKALIEKYDRLYWVGDGYGYNPYFDFPRHDSAFAHFIEIMNPANVLDVGCAYGYIVRRCLSVGVFAVGMDVSQWCGLQRVIPGYYIRGTGWALPFHDRSFDVIHCEGVLEHIPEDKIELVMSEFHRVAFRKYIGVSYDSPHTDLHVCNHPHEWWAEKVPPGTHLGITGESLDLEKRWYTK